MVTRGVMWRAKQRGHELQCVTLYCALQGDWLGDLLWGPCCGGTGTGRNDLYNVHSFAN